MPLLPLRRCHARRCFYADYAMAPCHAYLPLFDMLILPFIVDIRHHNATRYDMPLFGRDTLI